MEKNTNIYHQGVIAIDLMPRGFAYCVLSDSSTLTDWGKKTFLAHRSKGIINSFFELVNHYSPDVVVLENLEPNYSKKSPRTKKVIGLIGQECQERGIQTQLISRDDTLKAFKSLSVNNKDDIAKAVTNWFPELEDYLPPRRTIILSENENINIFDAVAMALAYYYRP